MLHKSNIPRAHQEIKLPVLDNPRYERMAQLLAEGMTVVDAHEQAGFVRNDSNSSKWANRPEIKARVTELTVKLAAKHEITRDSLVEDCKRVQRLAENANQLAVSMAAVKEIGILTGKRIERSERGAPGEFAFLEGLSEAELILYAKGELDLPDEMESVH
jgi:hypothetical protein